MVEETSEKVCTCPGLVTHCLVKSCWSKTVSLSVIAIDLKKAYESAKQVNELRNTLNTWRIPGRQENYMLFKNLYSVDNEKVRLLDMVYIDSSPNFCSPSDYGPGTSGRECSRTNNTCSVLCCGRGYKYVIKEVLTRCKCVAVWCCEVKCEQCVKQETQLLCN